MEALLEGRSPSVIIDGACLLFMKLNCKPKAHGNNPDFLERILLRSLRPFHQYHHTTDDGIGPYSGAYYNMLRLLYIYFFNKACINWITVSHFLAHLIIENF